MKRIAIPAIVALGMVSALVAVAGWNKSSEPYATLTLTEREMRLVRQIPDRTADDPGVQLHFEFAGREDPLDARNWLTEERLRAIGFAFDVMPSAPEAERTYGRALPKLAWVAFEYDGEAWRAIERQRALTADHSEQRHGNPTPPSHLVPVDASPDLATLARRYPQNHLFLIASIELVYVPPTRRGPLVYGRIRHLAAPIVYVPRALRPALAGLGPVSALPRYEADVAIGRLGLPYLVGLRRTASALQ